MDIMDRLKGPRRNLPIGIQSFERLRRDGYLYVDKTAFVYELASTGNPYFLSRPRRFGKSLLLSTLEAYFCGKKELFEGLAIEQLETEWNEHAVLHLDLNAEDYSEIEGLFLLTSTTNRCFAPCIIRNYKTSSAKCSPLFILY